MINYYFNSFHICYLFVFIYNFGYLYIQLIHFIEFLITFIIYLVIRDFVGNYKNLNYEYFHLNFN